MSSSTNISSQLLRSDAGARYARYIGRVGALAVSLGVGVAVLTTPGVALADSTDGTSPGATDSAPKESSKSSTESPQERRAERRRAIRTVVENALGSVSANGPRKTYRDVDSDGQLGAGAGDDKMNTGIKDTDTRRAGSGVTATVTARRGAAAVGATGTRARKAVNNVVQQIVSSDPAAAAPAVGPVVRRSAPIAASVTRVQARVNNAVDAAVQSAITAGSPVATRQPSVGIARSFSLPAPAPAPAPAPRPQALVSGFLAAVGLAPSLTPLPAPPPAPAPFAWAVLAFARREIEQQVQQFQRTFFNRTPVATDDTASIGEDDGATEIEVLGNDVDRDRGDVTTITGVTDGQYGTVTTDGTTVTYTPNDAANALADGETREDTFSYTVSDAESAPHVHGLLGLLTGGGHTDTATVTVTITGANDDPTAIEDVVAVSEAADETVIDVLANDTDPDTDPVPDTLTVTGATSGTYGDVTFDDGAVIYTPNDLADALADGETAEDEFSYTISDGHGGTATGTVKVTITGANDAPTVTGVSPTIRETDSGVVIGTINDPDAGDSFTVTRNLSAGVTPKGELAIVGDTITYTPSAETQTALAAGQSVTDEINYTVTDSHGATATATVTVTITGVNDATVLSTGDEAPVDIELGTDWGIIRNDDGTLTRVDFDEDDGWTVGAGFDTDFDAGDVALDVRYGYVEVQTEDSDDGMAVIDRDTGDVERVRDVSTGLDYSFGDVTDVAVDRRVENADVVYAVDSQGTVYQIDSSRREVVSRTDTRRLEFRADASATADATATASPKLAVAPGSRTVYVASGNKIYVVKRQTVSSARLIGEGDQAAAETDQLVHDADLDITLRDGGEITALETGEDGTLYATVVSADGSAPARLVRINVDAQTGVLTEGESVELGRDAGSIAINDSLDRGYVISPEDETMSVVDLRRLEVIDVVQTGAAGGVAVAPRTNTVLVTNPNTNAISVVSDTSVNPGAPLSITLDWGQQPQDLDAHLVGNTNDGEFHVYYLADTWQVEGETGASLDIDDVDGDGPEVIDLNIRSEGNYVFYVDNFSNDGGLVGSPTTVTVWDQSTGQKLGEFEVPDEVPTGSTGKYWAVFNINVDESGNVTIIPRNDGLSSAPPANPPPPAVSAVNL